MKQQTAVDYVKNRLINLFDLYPIESKVFDKIIDEAKQMEKEQIKEAYRQGCQDCPKHHLGEIIRKEQYYNETYNNGND